MSSQAPASARSIGACYCAGVPLDEMQHIATTTTFHDFGRWTPSWLGLATNQRLERYLARFTPAKTFEELTTPLAIAATDINAGVTVYYTRGPLGPPLRGSCAYPGLFVPIQFENRTLVDGFLTSPVPVEGTMLLGADVVIAVYLEAGSLEHPRTAADVISRSFTIIQRHADLAWRQQADVIIEPDVKPFVWDDFSHTNRFGRSRRSRRAGGFASDSRGLGERETRSRRLSPSLEVASLPPG